MYLDYAYYSGNGGTVTQAAFPLIEKQCEYKLDYWTHDRLKTLTPIPDSVKDLLVIMVNEFNSYEQLDVKGVTSFSNDGVSVSFGEAVTLKTVHDRLYDLAVEMLPVEIISAMIGGN